MNSLTVAAVSIAALAAVLFVQTEKRFTHPTSKDADGGMGRWMAVCQPSAAHARLAELVGSYDTTTRLWMAPDAEPMESKGTAEVSWLVEGKWLQSRSHGTVMGMTIDSTSLLGYDNFKERFVWGGVDSLQTCLNTASGLFTRDGEHLILWGTIDEPMTPEQDKQCKYVFRGFGQDTWTLEVHDMMIGEADTKVFEVEHVRRKK